jgi:uncharacterized membrane protein YeaQ/YmgE (transglycosylase-associated protein family)
MSLLVFIIIGLLAGWLASMVVRGRGLGCLGDTVVGVLGAVIGGWLLQEVGVVPRGGIGAFLTALFGAVILLTLVKLIKKV